MELLGDLFREILMRPMANSLVLLYIGLFNNFGLSIIVFTVIIRIATMQLTLKQIKSTRAMSTLQPKMKELQERYKNDRQKLSQETFKLYREHGVNPIGCLGPLVIQFPIWIGLYWALIRVLPSSPENLADLSQLLYGWLPVVHQAVPVDSTFLWLDLAVPDTLPVMPLLVGASMWVQQKMMTYPSQDPKQAQTQQMMLWMMPLLFVFLTFSFPSGLALYWLATNIMGVAIQYVTTGWGGLRPSRLQPQGAGAPAVAAAGATGDSQSTEELSSDGKGGSQRQDSGRGNRAGAKAARRKARRGRNRGSQSR
ncbi:MAG: YidC/Oxa1 family membrane protein insertase [Chloroflexota bacterium]|nr:YidC/Oxa1 family membrane protein insertase [Chloroflexota bacterium]MDE2899595.1 YidC/Oxa1 family membrane protein insertase [Chloroflexota bacterium]MDE2969643.1 YidC/Oxa1 family membrane protein insertase [Chloroflexota bacterium]